MRLRITQILSLLIAGACATAAAGTRGSEIRDGKALLQAMHDRYRNNWYDTLTFTQASVTHNPDGSSSSAIWQEAAMLPGKLRVDIGELSKGNGAIVADGTLTAFQGGKITTSRPFVHMLLVLGFDVYRQPPERTIEEASSQGFDLTKLHEETWEGVPVYVVGAEPGDLKTKQFWIQKNRLLFVRLIEPDERDKTQTDDTRFTDYKPLPVGWVAPRVELFIGGKNVFSEQYSDIQVNPKLDPAIFDPKRFDTSHWEK